MPVRAKGSAGVLPDFWALRQIFPPGAILLLVRTWQMGILGAGIVGAFAMATGTASLTIAVALAAVAMRHGTVAGLAGSPGLRAVSGLFEVSAGLFILRGRS